MCINQSDNLERSLEITKMRRVFSQATNVAIWLGRSYGSSKRAFAFIGLLYQNRNSKEAIIRIIKEVNAGEDLDAVDRLFNREYWNRVWVVQEIASDSLACNGPWRVSDRISQSMNTETSMQLLKRVVRKYKHLKSTDPRNKIYGLVG
jgi:hypothetical protein